ncbi:MbtH protein [Oceanobacillus polygoni]|uniref:MbtH protein n=2 Tax=Bacillaceae TaxID=186817 RepID=A0A9X1CGL1_9BACI|nr:MbtH protein [Oceanobacillus polygoni]
MMSNPFENPDGIYVVLINEEGQYSLWPDFLDIPSGWENVYGADNREKCLDYIKSHWHNQMPNSLRVSESIGSRA